MWITRMGAVGMLAAALLGCGSAAPGWTLRVAYRVATTHHYRYHSTVTGTERTAGGQRQDNTDQNTDAAWRILSVSSDGRASVEQTLSGSAATASRFTVAPNGLVTPGAGWNGAVVPGTTQFLAILPDRPVRPGDAWTSDVRLPGPPVTLHTRSSFERSEAGTAVVTSHGAGPFEFTIGRVRYRGTVDLRSTTWLAPGGAGVTRADSVVSTDFTAAGADPKGAVRFTGTYRLELGP